MPESTASPPTLTVAITPDRMRVELPLSVPQSGLRPRLLAMAAALSLAGFALGGALFVAGVDVGLPVGLLGGSTGLMLVLALAVSGRIQPTLWWPRLLGEAMPVLTLTRQELSIADHRGQRSVPLASIQAVRVDAGVLKIDRASGHEDVAWGLRSEETDYLVNLLAGHASRAREAAIAAGEEPDVERPPPSELQRIRGKAKAERVEVDRSER